MRVAAYAESMKEAQRTIGPMRDTLPRVINRKQVFARHRLVANLLQYLGRLELPGFSVDTRRGHHDAPLSEHRKWRNGRERLRYAPFVQPEQNGLDPGRMILPVDIDVRQRGDHRRYWICGAKVSACAKRQSSL